MNNKIIQPKLEYIRLTSATCCCSTNAVKQWFREDIVLALTAARRCEAGAGFNTHQTNFGSQQSLGTTQTIYMFALPLETPIPMKNWSQNACLTQILPSEATLSPPSIALWLINNNNNYNHNNSNKIKNNLNNNQPKQPKQHNNHLISNVQEPKTPLNICGLFLVVISTDSHPILRQWVCLCLCLCQW